MTDGGGGVVARQLHHPYGSVRHSEGTLPTDLTYTGQREVGLGLMHYGARYCHPALARFISADTIVPQPGDPQSLNRYAYVLGNPVRYTDPSGHMHWPGGGGEMRPWYYRARPYECWSPEMQRYTQEKVREITAGDWATMGAIFVLGVAGPELIGAGIELASGVTIAAPTAAMIETRLAFGVSGAVGSGAGYAVPRPQFHKFLG